MSSWLFEGAFSIALFVALIPLLIAPFLGVVYRTYSYPAPGPTLLAAATGLYACSMVAFTTFPLPEAPEEFCTERSGVDYWQLEPGASLGDVLAVAGDVGLLATLTSGVFLQLVFNVVFFIPLGFLVAYRLRRSLGAALLLGLGVSLLIEVTQGTGLLGLYPCPYRLADVDDLLTNTAGALIGWVLGRLVSHRWPFKEPPRRTDVAPPSLKRRLLASGLDLVVLVVITVGVEVGVALVEVGRGAEAESVRSVFVVLQFAVGFVLLLGVPLLRQDRATPGQLTVLLALKDQDASEPAHVRSVIVRFVVRWIPILVFGLVALLVVAAAEIATALIRSDRRSLAGVLGRTQTITHDSLATEGTASVGQSSA